MIQEDYVTFEQAKALKELGFPQERPIDNHIYYMDDNMEVYGEACGWTSETYYTRPTLSIVQKWLREEKNIELYCEPDYINKSEKFYIIHILGYIDNKYFHIDSNEKWNWKDGYIITYNKQENALSKGIDKCIELLQNR